MLGFGILLVIGFVIMALCIAGIVNLTGRWAHEDVSGRVILVIGILVLSLFGLGGLTSAGCGATGVLTWFRVG
jgi:hypothetical protein